MAELRLCTGETETPLIGYRMHPYNLLMSDHNLYAVGPALNTPLGCSIHSALPSQVKIYNDGSESHP